MEQTILQMMELLLANLTEMKGQAAANQKKLREDMKLQQEVAEAKEEARLERKEALLGLRPSEEVTKACPENLKPGLNEMEVAVVTIEDSSDKMEASDLEATQEATETAVEWQELCNKETELDNIRPLEDRYVDQRLVVRCCRLKTRTQRNNGGSPEVAGRRPKTNDTSCRPQCSRDYS
jgi:hypothetical protein